MCGVCAVGGRACSAHVRKVCLFVCVESAHACEFDVIYVATRRVINKSDGSAQPYGVLCVNIVNMMGVLYYRQTKQSSVVVVIINRFI